MGGFLVASTLALPSVEEGGDSRRREAWSRLPSAVILGSASPAVPPGCCCVLTAGTTAQE
jgi:hypothetical protein